MNDQFEGKWDQMKGRVREHWGRLTDDDVSEVQGRRERLLGKIQEKYGETKARAEEKVREFERRF